MLSIANVAKSRLRNQTQQKHAKSHPIKPRLGGVIHLDTCKTSKKAGTYTHPDLKTRTERTQASFFYRDPKEWNRLGLQHAEWSVNRPCSTVRFWELWRSQRTRFWSQLQGNRQVTFLTCRIISSLVEKHIVSHLSEFLAFMLHLHSVKTEQVIYHHQSDQHGHILRIQCLSPNSHISEKKVFRGGKSIKKVFN